MPDLSFQITGAAAAASGMTPLLHFSLQPTNKPENECIQAMMLHTQIQIESPRRPNNAREKERLSELSSTPERWGQALRNRLWIYLHRDSFERLHEYKRRHGLATWEQTVEHLISATERETCA